MIKNKKGSHVSFIISFVIFVGFLIFFVGIIRPAERLSSGKNLLMEHLEEKITEEISGEALVISVKLEDPSDCIDISGDFGLLNFAYKQDGNLLKIYSSDFFTGNTYAACQNPLEEYETGLSRKQNYVFYSEVLKLNESYTNDYRHLKETFGSPQANEFEFGFLDSDENILVKPTAGESPETEVFADRIFLRYFENSEIKEGYLEIRVW